MHKHTIDKCLSLGMTELLWWFPFSSAHTQQKSEFPGSVSVHFSMIFQKLLTNPSAKKLYFLTTTGLYTSATEESDSKFTPVWSLGGDSKATLLPVGSVNEKFAVLSDSLKQVYLVRLSDGQVQDHYRAEKCPTCILIESCDEEKVGVLVADRFGDVSRVVFHLGEEKKSAEVNVIVGHVSIITDMAIAGDSLITADRDEKLRVTCRTSPHTIKSFLLGHTEYVVATEVINDKVISVAADGTVRLWNLDADSSDSKATQLDIFVIDAEKYGRKVKAEKVISKTETDAQVEEEVEEVEKLIVEPYSMSVCKDNVAITFDRSSLVLVLEVNDDKIKLIQDIALPEGNQVLSAVHLEGDLQILTLDSSKFNLYNMSDLTKSIELGSSDGSSSTVEALWKGGMRKDCHGLFAKRVKSKRSKADQDLSDIDDEE